MKRQAKPPIVVVKGIVEDAPAPSPAPTKQHKPATKPPPKLHPKFGDKKEQQYYAERLGQVVDVLTVDRQYPLRGKLLWRDTYNICIAPLENTTRSGNTEPMLVAKTAIIFVQNVEPLPAASAQQDRQADPPMATM